MTFKCFVDAIDLFLLALLAILVLIKALAILRSFAINFVVLSLTVLKFLLDQRDHLGPEILICNHW